MKRLLLLIPILFLIAANPQDRKISFDGNDRFAVTAAGIFEKVANDCQIGPIIVEGRKKPCEIVLENNAAPAIAGRALEEDGYAISVDADKIVISGKDKGLVYGVCGFLKDYLGIEYWGDGEYFVPPVQGEKRYVQARNTVSEPAFSYRQTQNYLLGVDSLYKWWYRLEEPSEIFVDNLWVHTCNRLLPASRYGEAHPEYYAFYGGKRHPGSASQWCMSNPEVLEIVCERLDSLFKAHPEQTFISISQNDGSDTYCRCPECQAVMDIEGGPSGPILRFINKVAERFPDKTISTLAYLFSVDPPKVTKPRDNVSIMLCDIDCRRQTSLADNPSGQKFLWGALKGWAPMCKNLFVWDYGINFDNYLSPFPNFATMAENMKIFKENNVKMHFSQIASNRGGDFAELRSYLAANLMWDAYADADSLIQSFLDRYYGAAGKPLFQYIKIMEGAAVGSDVDLFIYDSPVSYKNNILRPVLMRRYNALFDKAEALVADDPVRLNRVMRSRLPLQYSALEIARTNPFMDKYKLSFDLDVFASRCKMFNVPTLNERSNPPAEYVELYRRRYLGERPGNLACGKKITYLLPPHKRYAALSENALTDGIYGGTTYVENWVGWEGTDGAFVLDLEIPAEIVSVSCDFLHQIGAWILLPQQVSYSTSLDGKSWEPLATIDIPEKRTGKVEFVEIEGRKDEAVNARYVKVEVKGVKTCPTWHYGVGNPCWFFIDEITVKEKWRLLK